MSATSGEQTRSISIHALREEGDASLPEGLLRRSISIHALREEGDIAVQHILERDANFYPRPPRGGRHLLSTALGTPTDFYPRPPRGGRRISPSLARDSRTFLSTPSARRATQHQHRKRLCWCISIHALREEGDLHPLFLDAIISDISIHALREEGDTGFGRLCCCGFPISIHALREEGDGQRGWSKTTPKYFYPRPPRGGRRCGRGSASKWRNYFYPRPPRGGRRTAMKNVLVDMLFLSTPSARRATSVNDLSNAVGQFLSTPSARRATACIPAACWPCSNFYPRPPRGGRRATRQLSASPRYFYPRPPRGGRRRQPGTNPRLFLFLSTPSARRATLVRPFRGAFEFDFYPRPPRGGRPVAPY